jgi:hypothetical protein
MAALSECLPHSLATTLAPGQATLSPRCAALAVTKLALSDCTLAYTIAY